MFSVYVALITTAIAVSSSSDHLNPVLDNYSQTSTQSQLTSASALRLRLLPRALLYLNDITSNLLANQLPRIFIPNIYHRFKNGQGTISLSHVRVSRYKRAKLYKISASEPNKLTWTSHDLNIGMIGDLSGELNIFVPLQLEGQVEVQTKGVYFFLQSAIKRSVSGAAHLMPKSCRTFIKMVHIESRSGGLAGIALNIFKETISERIRPLIQLSICQKVTRIIVEDLNKKLSQSQTQLTFSDALKTNSFGRYLIFDPNILRHFHTIHPNTSTYFFQKQASSISIDYRLSEDPLCYNNTIELAYLGEISSKIKTPFGMHPLEWPSDLTDSDSMVQILISDHIANALLYHSFNENLLKFTIDESTISSLKSFLQTTCPSSFCFADIIPEIGKRHPNKKIQFKLITTSAPVVLFSAKDSGLINVRFSGIVSINVYTDEMPHEEAAVFDINVIANIKLQIKNNLILMGSLKLDQFKLKNKLGTENAAGDELTDLEFLSSEFLQNLINSFLQNGFPIPLPEGLYLMAAKLRILDRKILISSEFSIDREHFSQFAIKTIFNSTF